MPRNTFPSYIKNTYKIVYKHKYLSYKVFILSRSRNNRDDTAAH